MVLLALFLSTAETAFGDEIYAVQGGELLRLSVDRPATTTTVGPLIIRPLDLTFTPEDELLALERDGAIYRIDPETASSTRLRAGLPDSEFTYWHITAAAGGQVYLARGTDLGQRPEWTVLDLETGQEKLIDEIHLTQDRSRSLPIRSLYPAVAGNSLVALGQFPGDIARVFAMGPGTAGVTPIRPFESTRPGPLDTDSDGDFWILRESPLFTEASLSSVDAQTGEVTNKASYSYTEDLPQAFAIRRGNRLTCANDEASLCLLKGRYRVTATWEDFEGRTGVAKIVRGSSDFSGLLWFFSDDNWELMVKVIDGCLVNNRMWAFVAGTTNAGYTVIVTDTLSGAERVFVNPLGQTSDTVLDTDAFEGCHPTVP